MSEKYNYREVTNKFFNAINTQKTSDDETPYTFEDLEYLVEDDEMAIVHFHIKECAGWKFGIWWYKPNKEIYCGDFFTQYEELKDKFKPSRSPMSCEIVLNNASDTIDEWAIPHTPIKLIEFIINEPALAFCRDYCYWDYNYEYHTREEAEQVFREFKDQHNLEINLTKELDDKVLDWVRKNILPMFHNARIEDMGENWSPRYDVVAPITDNLDIVNEPGHYSWFDSDNNEHKKLKKEFDKLIDNCEKIAQDNNIWWFKTMYATVIFYFPEKGIF